MVKTLLNVLIDIFIGYSLGDEVRITNETEFSAFVNTVNSGSSNYSGTTVFLDSDLSLSGYAINPIGNSSSYRFRGVFDGQGYVISNLTISSSSSYYAGLFGYSKGLTVRNVILGSSCSIINTYSRYEDVYVGGTVGYCSGQCNIENNVNMANVSFSGTIRYLYIGGIAGYLPPFSSNRIYVKNCANYGAVTHSGTSSNSYIGGIVGYLANSYYKYVYNCLNYGTITHSGTTSHLYLGGITGYASYAYIENCVSAGMIYSLTKASSHNYVGSLVGETYSYTYINYCYYAKDVGTYSMYIRGTPTSIFNTLSYSNDTFALSKNISIGTYTGYTLIDALNVASDYYMLRDYSHWLLNKNNKTVSFTINNRTNPTKMNYQIILLPSLASEGNISFDGWYTNSGCTTPLASYEITAGTTFYGKFEQNANYYTITFDTKGGSSVSPIQAQFGTNISLPKSSTKDSCTFVSWGSNCGDNVGFSFTMPAQDITLYAVWKCTHIKTPDDFLDFSKVVNSGLSDYSGTTVFLDSDLSLSGYATINPIGTSSSYQFHGVFDGQGYVINYLTISSSSSYYTGLFGYSEELIIRNVILDSSCSIINTYSIYEDVYVGGIIGYCYGQCNIKNNVNMASVSFSGSISGYSLYLGGIAGYLQSSSSYVSIVKNCANYGSVTHSGTSRYLYIGGIVGYLANSYYKYIYNCLNYGTITHNGTASSNLYLGGITGYASYAYIENCVSAGKISSFSISKYIGSLVGSVDYGTYINYCYYTDGLSGYNMYRSGTPMNILNTLSYNSDTFELNETVIINNKTEHTLIDALNAASDYYMLRGYSHWLLNKDIKAVSFTINGRASPFKMDYQIILLPSLASEGNVSFDGWYTNSGCTTPLTSYEVTTIYTSLYGKFEENTNYYTITFDTRGGTPVPPIQAQFGTNVSFPCNLTKEQCIVGYWESNCGDNVGFGFIMPAHNITLYAVWKCTHIKTPDDFLDFSKVVNSGSSNYSGTTVLLDSDLSLSKYTTINPIGTSSTYQFCGVFDGQGYVISNLNITKYSQYTGLFGYSSGLTIRNVVLDSSCSITNIYGYEDVFVGGIIGYCSGKCNIENNVNMASILFSGSISGSYDDLYIGGIAGYLRSYKTYVKNCANYESITHSGTSSYSYLGGIVGYLDEIVYDSYKYIYNCLNYGTITHSGTTSYLYLGGIAGLTSYAYIENCVSAGKISILSAAKYNNYIGSLVGYVDYGTYINYCYYTDELNSFNMYGRGTPTSISNALSYNNNNTFELNETVIINNSSEHSLIDALNAASDYYLLREYSYWLLNKNCSTITFIINGGTNTIIMNFQVILLPSLTGEGKLWFNGWYNDSKYESVFMTPEVVNDASLYGKFEENTNYYTITFDTRGGTPVSPIQAQFGAIVSLSSSSIRNGCTIGSWETVYGDNVGLSLIMPAYNITLYAVWKCIHIKTPNDFLVFMDNVNTGTSFSGTTIFLDSDVSLSGYTINPIGNSSSYQFRDVFDGKGHVIKNLNITKSSLYVGLFGHSRGLTIRNVVLDSSCSISNTYSGSNKIYVGGIIGYCYGQCNIENCVNMASISFSGSIIGSGYYPLYLGGIAGYLQSSNRYYNIYVKNCANYGSVTRSGTSRYSYIGGVLGYLTNSYYKYIYNCLNYGTITHSGTTSNDLYLGGIAGYTWYAYIENCVSAGRISSNNNTFVGSLIGSVDSYTYINYCYYTDELNDFNMNGDGSSASISNSFSYNGNTFLLNETVSIGDYSGISLIDALNTASDYYMLRDYSHWMLNRNNKTVSFTINSRASPFKMDFQIILLPSLASEGNISFDGWYTDSGCTTPLTSYEITTSDTSLYGKYEINTNNYSITFDTRREGIFVPLIQAHFGATILLPNSSTRDYCTIGSWETVYGDNVGLSLIMPARNITLYAVWKCTHIKIPDDFLDFSKVVNSGSSDYSGTTVFLDSDLSFSGYSLNPIGYDYNYHFRGVFDGQGYVISNLNITSSSYYVGLFGRSGGLTIRNVVLDSSCSISNSYSSFYRNVGGIIGGCYSDYDQCNIENNVNMANVTFSGNNSYNTLYLGGIAGFLHSYSSYVSIVKNCANYGSVTHSGTSSYSYLGGIVGTFYYYNSYIYNCFNYGTIIHNGTTSGNLYLGGIVGYTRHAYIENSVSAGVISSNNITFVGSLVGYANSNTYINYCYYTNDVGNYSMYGIGTPTSELNTPNISSEVNQTLIANLNNQVTTENGWNKWILNLNNETIAFKVNNNNGFSLSSQIILLPDLIANNSFVFSGWYTDPYYITPLQSDEVSENMILYSLYGVNVNVTFNATGGNVVIISKNVVLNSHYGELPTPTMTGHTFTGWFTEDNENIKNETIVRIASDHTLYAKWMINKYTLIFNFNNGTGPEERILGYNSSIIYPNITEREGYTSNGWDRGDIEFMPAENITVTAQWIPNNYTVFLNVSGGDKLGIDKITVTFNESYGGLPMPNKTGYTFVGWSTENNENITSESIVRIASDHTLYARWIELISQEDSSSSAIETPTNKVEIIFNTKDLSKKEIIDAIKQYTEDEFTITCFENTSNEIKVIIKFNDVESAIRFTEKVKSTSDSITKDIIKNIKYSFSNAGSFSPLSYPFIPFTIFIL